MSTIFNFLIPLLFSSSFFEGGANYHGDREFIDTAPTNALTQGCRWSRLSDRILFAAWLLLLRLRLLLLLPVRIHPARLVACLPHHHSILLSCKHQLCTFVPSVPSNKTSLLHHSILSSLITTIYSPSISALYNSQAFTPTLKPSTPHQPCFDRISICLAHRPTSRRNPTSNCTTIDFETHFDLQPTHLQVYIICGTP